MLLKYDILLYTLFEWNWDHISGIGDPKTTSKVFNQNIFWEFPGH